jgi:hypothetical protein
MLIDFQARSPASLTLAGLAVFFMTAVACDPMGPGAFGVVELAAEANSEGARSLELRARPIIGAEEGALDGDAWVLSESIPLEDGAGFPMEYSIGYHLGTTEHKDWQVLLWLSTGESGAGPRGGEWYGTGRFELVDCGPAFSGYCGSPGGPRLTIDRQVP